MARDQLHGNEVWIKGRGRRFPASRPDDSRFAGSSREFLDAIKSRNWRRRVTFLRASADETGLLANLSYRTGGGFLGNETERVNRDGDASRYLSRGSAKTITLSAATGDLRLRGRSLALAFGSWRVHVLGAWSLRPIRITKHQAPHSPRPSTQNQGPTGSIVPLTLRTRTGCTPESFGAPGSWSPPRAPGSAVTRVGRMLPLSSYGR